MATMPGSWGASDSDSEEQHPASSSGPPHPLQNQDAPTYAARRMLSRRPEYLSPRRIAVKVGSWNIGNFQCWGDVREWLPELGGAEENTATDIYVLALQEVVDLAQTSSFLRYTDPKTALTWKAHVQVTSSRWVFWVVGWWGGG